MRLKYIVEKKPKNNKLLLREFYLVDKDSYSLMNEAEYDKKMLSAAKKEGVSALVAALRSPNMYPPAVYAERIAEGIMEILTTQKTPTLEIHIDDLDLVEKNRRFRRKTVPIEGEPEDLDDVDELIEDCDDETCTIKEDDTGSDLVETFPFDEVA